MDVAPIDPRDTQREQAHPVYRVYFWDRASAAARDEPDRSGWRSDEWRVTHADDVHEVLAWATGPAGHGRQFQLFVEANDAGGHGLLRLTGSDPTASD